MAIREIIEEPNKKINIIKNNNELIITDTKKPLKYCYRINISISNIKEITMTPQRDIIIIIKIGDKIQEIDFNLDYNSIDIYM